MTTKGGDPEREPLRLTPKERAAKREAIIQGMMAKGYSRERSEEIIGHVAKTLFGPGGRFAKATP